MDDSRKISFHCIKFNEYLAGLIEKVMEKYLRGIFEENFHELNNTREGKINNRASEKNVA